MDPANELPAPLGDSTQPDPERGATEPNSAPDFFPSFSDMLLAGLREECERLRRKIVDLECGLAGLGARSMAGLSRLADALETAASASPEMATALGAITRLVGAVLDRVARIRPVDPGTEPEPQPEPTSTLEELQRMQDRLRAALAGVEARELEERLRVVRELLPIDDALTRFLREGEPARIAADAGVHVLGSLLAELGAVRVESLNRRFTPEVHIAQDKVAVPGPEEDEVIVSVVEEGYFVRDKLVRPARVVVGIYESATH